MTMKKEENEKYLVKIKEKEKLLLHYLNNCIEILHNYLKPIVHGGQSVK